MQPGSKLGPRRGSVQHNATCWRLPGNHICSGFAAIMAEVCLQTPPCIVSGVLVIKTCWEPDPTVKIPFLFSCKASSTDTKDLNIGAAWLGMDGGSAWKLLKAEFPECIKRKAKKGSRRELQSWKCCWLRWPSGVSLVPPLGGTWGSPDLLHGITPCYCEADLKAEIKDFAWASSINPILFLIVGMEA